MPDQLTLYSRTHDALPADLMSALGDDILGTSARYHRDGESHVYTWDDLQIRCTAMPRGEIPEHLKGFLGFAIEQLGNDDAPILARIRATTLVVGIVIEPGYDPRGRAEELIGRMVARLTPLVFTPEGLFDEHGNAPLHTASPEALARRARSIARMRAERIPVIESLPFIETEAQAKLRSREEIIERAIALAFVAARAEGLELDRARALIAKWEAQLTPAERELMAMEAPTDHERAQFVWRYEGLSILLWALGHLDDDAVGAPDGIVDAGRMVGVVIDLGPDGFRAAGVRKDAAAILDAADAIYRYHWAVVDARMRGEPVPAIDPGVVYERHYALNWLIGYGDQDWDDVSTDT